MIRTPARVALIACGLAAAVAAQASLTGEWAMSFTTPRGGRSEYTLYMTQEGPRLTGHLTSEYGETSVKGSVNGDEVKLAWSIIENGKPLDISVTATAKGDAINGTIKLGTVGEGVFSAERTGGQ
jgi:D-glucosaminate-6-phosphate ammonia-lyase